MIQNLTLTSTMRHGRTLFHPSPMKSDNFSCSRNTKWKCPSAPAPKKAEIRRRL